MSRIAIVVDSSCDITNDEAEQLGIYVIRMPVIVNNKEYLEYDDIDEIALAKLMKEGAIPKTAQPTLGRMTEMWNKLLQVYDEILFIPLSSKLSGTYQSAYFESQEFSSKVTVVDALFACAPTKFLIRYAKEMILKGYSCTQIKDKLEHESGLYAVLIPEDLVYLKRGGRISAAGAALAGMLKIVPLLSVNEGAIDVITKVRTAKKAYSTAIEHIMNVDDVDDYDWMFLSVDFKDDDLVYNQFKNALGKDVAKDRIRAVIMAHTGPGTIAFARIKKPKY